MRCNVTTASGANQFVTVDDEQVTGFADESDFINFEFLNDAEDPMPNGDGGGGVQVLPTSTAGKFTIKLLDNSPFVKVFIQNRVSNKFFSFSHTNKDTGVTMSSEISTVQSVGTISSGAGSNAKEFVITSACVNIDTSGSLTIIEV